MGKKKKDFGHALAIGEKKKKTEDNREISKKRGRGRERHGCPPGNMVHAYADPPMYSFNCFGVIGIKRQRTATSWSGDSAASRSYACRRWQPPKAKYRVSPVSGYRTAATSTGGSRSLAGKVRTRSAASASLSVAEPRAVPLKVETIAAILSWSSTGWMGRTIWLNGMLFSLHKLVCMDMVGIGWCMFYWRQSRRNQ